jgi:hypothetical protein
MELKQHATPAAEAKAAVSEASAPNAPPTRQSVEASFTTPTDRSDADAARHSAHNGNSRRDGEPSGGQEAHLSEFIRRRSHSSSTSAAASDAAGFAAGAQQAGVSQQGDHGGRVYEAQFNFLKQAERGQSPVDPMLEEEEEAIE